MDDKDLNNINEEEDVLYFGDRDKSYEAKQNVYSEDDMYENYKPLTNTNSMEYDEGDYAYSNYELMDEDDKDTRKRVIIAYITVLVLIILVVTILVIS